jgi:hypothetical protein
MLHGDVNFYIKKKVRQVAHDIHEHWSPTNNDDSTVFQIEKSVVESHCCYGKKARVMFRLIVVKVSIIAKCSI